MDISTLENKYVPLVIYTHSSIMNTLGISNYRDIVEGAAAGPVIICECMI